MRLPFSVVAFGFGALLAAIGATLIILGYNYTPDPMKASQEIDYGKWLIYVAIAIWILGFIERVARTWLKKKRYH